MLNIPDDLGLSLFQQVKSISTAIKKGVQAQGVFIASNITISQSIMHAHIHLIPRSKGDGLKGFFWPRVTYESEDQMRVIQSAIRKQ